MALALQFALAGHFRGSMQEALRVVQEQGLRSRDFELRAADVRLELGGRSSVAGEVEFGVLGQVQAEV